MIKSIGEKIYSVNTTHQLGQAFWYVGKNQKHYYILCVPVFVGIINHPRWLN